MQHNLLCHTAAALATNPKLPAGPNQARGREAFTSCGCRFDMTQFKTESWLWCSMLYSRGDYFSNG